MEHRDEEDPASPPVRIGISSCLLGEEVRHDGGHKLHQGIAGDLGPRVEWVPVCPEVEAGMGVPREPVHLVRAADGSLRMRGVVTGRDWTEAMNALAAARAGALEALGLSGYILKSRSPSCGLAVGVSGPGGEPQGAVPGLFAAALRLRLPELPVAEESALADSAARQRFLERVLAYHGRRAARRAQTGPGDQGRP
jgi:uncharacterized protein YbbK (DUF523 family)